MAMGEGRWAERSAGPGQLQQRVLCLPDAGEPGELVPMQAGCCPCTGVGGEQR